MERGERLPIVCPVSNEQPPASQDGKPPKRHWNATEPFIDMRASHWAEVVLTIALLAVGIGQLFVYFRQASIMEKQTAIAATQKDISSGQLKMTIANERPYVAMDTMDAVGVPVKDGANPQWTFSPLWSNLGNTPTRNLTINIHCLTSATSRVDDIGNEPELPKGTSQSFLGPKVNQEIGNCTTRGDYMRLVKDGASFFYVIGRADYTDTWGGPSYITEFCSEMHVIQGDPGILNSGMIFRSTLCNGAFNCADDECIRQRHERSAK